MILFVCVLHTQRNNSVGFDDENSIVVVDYKNKFDFRWRFPNTISVMQNKFLLPPSFPWKQYFTLKLLVFLGLKLMSPITLNFRWFRKYLLLGIILNIIVFKILLKFWRVLVIDTIKVDSFLFVLKIYYQIISNTT